MAKTEADSAAADIDVVKPAVRSLDHSISKGANAKHIQVSAAVLKAARQSAAELLRDSRSLLEGLTQAEVEERARTVGPNEVAQEKPQGWPIRLLKITRNPLVILLAHSVDGFLRYWRCPRRYCHGLDGGPRRRAALRSGGPGRFRRRQAPGDDQRPRDRPPRRRRRGDADRRPGPRRRGRTRRRRHDPRRRAAAVLQRPVLIQASLTGESFPVEKFAAREDARASPLELTNVCYLGTSVESGAATAVVVATGPTPSSAACPARSSGNRSRPASTGA